MSQITGVLFLLAMCLSTTSFAQSLQEMQKHYDTMSPYERERLKNEQTVDPDKIQRTPAEEQLAELKAKEAADKAALEKKIYLDTDFKFFQTMNAVTLEEDELDKVYKKAQDSENVVALKQTDQSIKSEIKTTVPQTKVLNIQEAATADARRERILKRISANASAVKKCIVDHRQESEPFKGTLLTLSWQVETSGSVSHAQIKETDLESKEIQNCVLKSLSELNFNEEGGPSKVTAHIEYTYKFKMPKELAAAQ